MIEFLVAGLTCLFLWTLHGAMEESRKRVSAEKDRDFLRPRLLALLENYKKLEQYTEELELFISEVDRRDAAESERLGKARPAPIFPKRPDFDGQLEEFFN